MLYICWTMMGNGRGTIPSSEIIGDFRRGLNDLCYDFDTQITSIGINHIFHYCSIITYIYIYIIHIIYIILTDMAVDQNPSAPSEQTFHKSQN